ncbi:uncharacterized protein LOC108097404 [Drosophila ficusphila]|uniref:uncharacterized protein LOC108097404 n=1 Tax=Drosophila ficusphila TaxID=30025 RepID=UPI0007E7D6EE|nr:uncharacterized protein LOC108097404 [Drosophila ficusphila]
MGVERVSCLLLLSILCVHGHLQRIWSQNGPLYESTKLLLAGQSTSAARIWNRTQLAIYERSERLQVAKDNLDEQQRRVSARLEEFFEGQYSAEWQVCAKKYELQVAHFNRELLDKYSVCRNSLDHVMDHFQQEIVLEAEFLSKASSQIANLAKKCKTWQLKQSGFNHAGVLFCTVAGIGGINQRMSGCLELCDDILLEMAMEDLDTPSCLFYHHLKMQFDEVLDQIDSCAGN